MPGPITITIPADEAIYEHILVRRIWVFQVYAVSDLGLRVAGAPYIHEEFPTKAEAQAYAAKNATPRPGMTEFPYGNYTGPGAETVPRDYHECKIFCREDRIVVFPALEKEPEQCPQATPA